MMSPQINYISNTNFPLQYTYYSYPKPAVYSQTYSQAPPIHYTHTQQKSISQIPISDNRRNMVLGSPITKQYQNNMVLGSPITNQYQNNYVYQNPTNNVSSFENYLSPNRTVIKAAETRNNLISPPIGQKHPKNLSIHLPSPQNQNIIRINNYNDPLITHRNISTHQRVMSYDSGFNSVNFLSARNNTQTMKEKNERILEMINSPERVLRNLQENVDEIYSIFCFLCVLIGFNKFEKGLLNQSCRLKQQLIKKS